MPCWAPTSPARPCAGSSTTKKPPRRKCSMSDTLIICIALMGALIFVLGANVTRHRAMRGKSGEPQQSTDPTDRLYIAQRAHGNASEYIPTLIGLLIVCATLTDGWWLNALAI